MMAYLIHSIRVVAVVALLLPLTCFRAEAQQSIRADMDTVDFGIVPINTLSPTQDIKVTLMGFTGTTYLQRTWTNNDFLVNSSSSLEGVDTLDINDKNPKEIICQVRCKPHNEGVITDVLTFSSTIGGRTYSATVILRVDCRIPVAPAVIATVPNSKSDTLDLGIAEIDSLTRVDSVNVIVRDFADSTRLRRFWTKDVFSVAGSTALTAEDTLFDAKLSPLPLSYRISAKPQRIGVVVDSLIFSLTANGRDIADTLWLRVEGRAPQPRLQASTDTLDFGIVELNTTSPQKIAALRLTNFQGVIPIRYSWDNAIFSVRNSVALSGSDNRQVNTSQPLDIQYPVSVTPTQEGIFYSPLIVSVSVQGQNYRDTVWLRVDARSAPNLPSVKVLPPDTLDFGVVAVNTTSTVMEATVRIRNFFGNTPLHRLWTNSIFAINDSTSLSVTDNIRVDTTQIDVSFKVNVHPTNIGVFTDSVIFSTVAGGRVITDTLWLRVDSRTAFLSSLELLPKDTLDFGDVEIHSSSRTDMITLTLTNMFGFLNIWRSWEDTVFRVQGSQSLHDTDRTTNNSQQLIKSYTVSVIPDREGVIITPLVFGVNVQGLTYIDTVWLRVNGQRSTPRSATSFFHLTNDSASIGTTVQVCLIADSVDGKLLATGNTGWQLQLRFNQSLLVPQTSVPLLADEIDGRERSVTLNGLLPQGFKAGDTLLRLPCVVTLGDAEQTSLRTEFLQWTNSGTILRDSSEVKPGSVYVDNLWRHGGVRLVNPNTGALQLYVYADNTSQQLYATVLFDTQGAALGIYDIMGNRILDASHLLPSLPQKAYLTVDITGLSQGLYFCRLSLGSYTIVRSFVIE